MLQLTNLFLVMMSVMSPVIVIVFITQYFKYKKQTSAKIEEMRQKLNENPNKELEKEVAVLEDRIQVLERIVTDSRYDLDRKIANL